MAAPKILCDTAGMDRKTWLAVRAHGPDGSIPITIGGSDVAAIFGISPWKTPLDLWLEKSGKLLPNESENLWQKEIGHYSNNTANGKRRLLHPQQLINLRMRRDILPIWSSCIGSRCWNAFAIW